MEAFGKASPWIGFWVLIGWLFWLGSEREEPLKDCPCCEVYDKREKE